MNDDYYDPFSPYDSAEEEGRYTYGIPQHTTPAPEPQQPPVYDSPNLDYDLPYSTQPGYMGLEYWQSRADQLGAPSSMGDMFDENGQLKPGWVRTERGYEFRGGGPSAIDPALGMQPQDPYAGQYPTTYGGGVSSRGDGGANLGRAPGLLPFPAYQSAGPFQYDPFSPSSWEDAENEPGYKASRGELRKQIEAGAAYRGMLRSGMTIGDLYKNLDALSQQNFKQFDDRRFRNWAGNRDLAAQKYGFHSGDVERRNNYQFNVADRSFADDLARWQEQVRSLTQISTAGGD